MLHLVDNVNPRNHLYKQREHFISLSQFFICSWSPAVSPPSHHQLCVTLETLMYLVLFSCFLSVNLSHSFQVCVLVGDHMSEVISEPDLGVSVSFHSHKCKYTQKDNLFGEG